MAILGRVTVDELLLLTVDTDPTVSGVTAPIGSIALIDNATNGNIWVKTGAADLGWTLQPKPAAGSVLQSNTLVITDANANLATNTTQLVWDSVNARLGIGSGAPAVPVNTIHLDRGTALGSGIKFTAGTTTGQTSGDGFSLGIDGTGTAFLTQYENSQLVFQTNNTRVMTLTPAGQALVGTSTVAIDITGLSAFPLFQFIGTAAVQMAGIQYSADTIGPVFNILKSRGATVGTQGLVSQDDEFGRIQFRASDGVNFQAGASVRALVDGTAAAGSMPGRLIFLTTPIGATTPVERMRISQNGLVRVVDNFQSFRRVFDFATQAAANTTTTLTSSSAGTQIFTGATAGQIVKLPDATTLVVGAWYEIINLNTTITIALQDNSGTALATIPAVNGVAFCRLLTNGSAAGTWSVMTDFPAFYQEVTSAAGMSLTSTTDVLVTGMTMTPAAGVYRVTFDSTLNNTTTNNAQTWGVGVYVGGVQNANSDRSYISQTNSFGTATPGSSALVTSATVTVNGSQAIEIRARRSAGTVTINNRNMTIIRVG